MIFSPEVSIFSLLRLSAFVQSKSFNILSFQAQIFTKFDPFAYAPPAASIK